MKTIEFKDGIAFAKDMTVDEWQKFQEEWKSAFSRGDSVIWSDVVVLGEFPKMDEAT